MKRLLLVSGTGFLGKTLHEGLNEAFSVNSTARNGAAGSLPLDLEKAVAPQLEAALADKSYAYGVICAAVTDVEECFRNPERSHKINIEATAELLRLFKRFKIKPVFFSSDLVFGNTRDFYREEDECLPSTLYGRQKLAIEQLIRAEFSDYIIFRTSKLMSFDLRPRSILASLILAMQHGHDVKAFTDQYITPVFIEDVAAATGQALAAGLRGTFHLAHEQRFSRLELAQLVARTLGFASPRIAPILTGDLKFGEERGTKFTLESGKIRAALPGLRFRSVPEGLELLRARL